MAAAPKELMTFCTAALDLAESERVCKNNSVSELTMMTTVLLGALDPKIARLSPRRTSDLSTSMVGAIKIPVTLVLVYAVTLTGNDCRLERLPFLSSP